MLSVSDRWRPEGDLVSHSVSRSKGAEWPSPAREPERNGGEDFDFLSSLYTPYTTYFPHNLSIDCVPITACAAEMNVATVPRDVTPILTHNE
jgi:hypothetical protein